MFQWFICVVECGSSITMTQDLLTSACLGQQKREVASWVWLQAYTTIMTRSKKQPSAGVLPVAVFWLKDVVREEHIQHAEHSRETFAFFDEKKVLRCYDCIYTKDYFPNLGESPMLSTFYDVESIGVIIHSFPQGQLCCSGGVELKDCRRMLYKLHALLHMVTHPLHVILVKHRSMCSARQNTTGNNLHLWQSKYTTPFLSDYILICSYLL